jgi:hypothetical protein
MTATRKPRPKPERRVNISRPVNGNFAIHMTIGTGEKAQHFGYYLQPIAADFGLGFHVEKFSTEQVEGEPVEYDVHIDTQRGYHSCTCKGGTFVGRCKHQEAVLALIAAGRIAVPQVQQKPALKQRAAEKPAVEPRPARCPHRCGCPLEDHVGTPDDPWALCPL